MIHGWLRIDGRLIRNDHNDTVYLGKRAKLDRKFVYSSGNISPIYNYWNAYLRSREPSKKRYSKRIRKFSKDGYIECEDSLTLMGYYDLLHRCPKKSNQVLRSLGGFLKSLGLKLLDSNADEKFREKHFAEQYGAIK
jgi:hypothetical protein